MPLHKTYLAPNGAAVAYHRVVRVDVTLTGTETTVQSWPDEDAYLAGMPALWNSRIRDEQPPSLLAAMEGLLVRGNGDFGGGTLLEDSGTDVEQARRMRWAAFKAQRDAQLQAPIAVAGYMVNADDASLIKLMGAALTMPDDPVVTKSWRCADNVMRPLTKAELFGIGQAIAARTQVLIDLSDEVYRALQEATTIAEIEAVVWPPVS